MAEPFSLVVSFEKKSSKIALPPVPIHQCIASVTGREMCTSRWSLMLSMWCKLQIAKAGVVNRILGEPGNSSRKLRRTFNNTVNYVIIKIHKIF